MFCVKIKLYYLNNIFFGEIGLFFGVRPISIVSSLNIW